MAHPGRYRQHSYITVVGIRQYRRQRCQRRGHLSRQHTAQRAVTAVISHCRQSLRPVALQLIHQPAACGAFTGCGYLQGAAQAQRSLHQLGNVSRTAIAVHHQHLRHLCHQRNWLQSVHRGQRGIGSQSRSGKQQQWIGGRRNSHGCSVTAAARIAQHLHIRFQSGHQHTPQMLYQRIGGRWGGIGLHRPQCLAHHRNAGDVCRAGSRIGIDERQRCWRRQRRLRSLRGNTECKRQANETGSKWHVVRLLKDYGDCIMTQPPPDPAAGAPNATTPASGASLPHPGCRR